MTGFSIQRLVLIAICGAALLLAGCTSGDGDGGELPTRFLLPSATPSPTLDNAVAQAGTPVAQIQTEAAQTQTAVALAEQVQRDPSAGAITSTPEAPTTPGTPTVTPSKTITPTPLPTLTPTTIPTLDPGPVDFLAELARNATVLPVDLLTNAPPVAASPTIPLPPGPGGATPTTVTTTSCQYLPPGGFGTLLLNRPELVAQVGCPVGTPPDTLSLASAYQPFEGGAMFWLQEGSGYITVLYANGRFERFEDTYVDGVDPVSGNETPPDDRFEPVRGFGKIWRDFATVRDALGWATQTESGTQTTAQNFDSGRMLSIPIRGDIIVLIYQGSPATGTWQAFPGTF